MKFPLRCRPAPAARVILTDVPGRTGHFWGDHTTLITPRRWKGLLERFVGERWACRVSGLETALSLLGARGRCSGIVTGGGPCGMIFAWLQSLIPWGKKRHVMVDCNWYVPGNPLRRWLKTVEVQLAGRSVDTFVVWASHEVKDYSTAFGLPQKKFTYVPFHHTLSRYHYRVRDDGYVFAGGNYDRDYRTLIEAVRSLEVPVWIATNRQADLLANVDLPAQVRVEGTSHAGFRRAMAGAKVVIVPMQPGLLHSGGQQTCLNAMMMGKPTIAVGRPWASDFITEKETGLIVDYEDAEGMRSAIRWVYDHAREATEMGQRAQAHAQFFSTRRCMEFIYRRAINPANMV